MTVKDILIPNDFEHERAMINDKWWWTRNLVRESKDLEVFDLDLMSVDLGVMPWECKSILYFAGHMLDVNNCNLKYPVILAPSGWVMDGWHRVVKAVMQGKKTIKAVRFVTLPEPDGSKNTYKEQE